MLFFSWFTAFGCLLDQLIKFGKLNVTENRRLVIALKVMGVPTSLFYKGGEQKERITGDEVTLEAIRAGTERLLS